MVAPNTQKVVCGHHIVVSLISGKSEASIAIRPLSGKGGGLHPPKCVNIDPLLKGGLSEREALDYLLDVVSAGLEGHERGNG